MAGIYGIDPIFTYNYDDNTMNNFNSCQKILTYPKESLMYYLEENHPIFCELIRIANYQGFFSDMQFRITLFLPTEESLKQLKLENFDIDAAKKFIDYHSMNGYFPQSILMTSPYQELQSKIKGQTIIGALYYLKNTKKETILLNKTSYIQEFDKISKNGIAHIIDRPLQFPDFL